MQFLFQDVLNEITRLKEEANRFISILSQEDDPDKSDELLSPGKRQSLTREVESLQVNFLYFSVKYISLFALYVDGYNPLFCEKKLYLS